MPAWTAFGWKSRTRVASLEAPGSAPSPSQPARAAEARMAASSAATHLIEAPRIGSDREACIDSRATFARRRPREEVARSAGSRTCRIHHRADRDAVPGIRHLHGGGAL